MSLCNKVLHDYNIAVDYKLSGTAWSRDTNEDYRKSQGEPAVPRNSVLMPPTAEPIHRARIQFETR